MFYGILTFTLLLTHSVSSIHSQNSVNFLTVESCYYGDTVENLCSKCVCTTNGLYVCEPRDCQPVKEIYLKKPEACHPNKVYKLGSTTCICTADGQWPHKACYDVFRYLPKHDTTKKTCKPRGYVRVGCNVCRCNDKGLVDSTRCTINECDDEKPKYRKNNEPNKSNLFGQCLVKNWYSLAPCQFCYCIDTNKLMCSTSISQSNRQGQMALGSSTLTLCGPGLLKEIAALVPNQRKLRSLIVSSNEDQSSNNDLDDRRSGNAEVTAKRYLLEIEKRVNNNDVFKGNRAAAADTQIEMAHTDYYDEDVPKAEGKENKNKPQDLTINIAASFDANKHRKQNEGPPKRNYDPFDGLRNFLKDRRALTLDTNSKCKPGTAVTIKCNLCHCLKNGKMLCTNNKCE